MACKGFSCWTPVLSLLPPFLLHLFLSKRRQGADPPLPCVVSTTLPSAFAIMRLSCFLLPVAIFNHVLTFLMITCPCVCHISVWWISGSPLWQPADPTHHLNLHFYLYMFFCCPTCLPLQASMLHSHSRHLLPSSFFSSSYFTSTCN